MRQGVCLSDNNNNGCFQLVLMKQRRFPTTFPCSCDANLDQGDEDEKRYQCTLYNRSCILLVKLNTLKGGLECSKTNILKVSLFEHFKEQFFYIFLRTSGHCFEWTFHPLNTISLLVDGWFSRKCYNKPLCVFDISIPR